MQKVCSKSLPQLFKQLEANLPPYDVISSYNGDDFTEPISRISPIDSIINLSSSKKWDVNLCILQPHSFYYSKVPSYLKVLEGCVWTELQIGADSLNPGFMLHTNKSVQLVQPYILNNTGMNSRNIILSINETIPLPTKNLPLL